VAEVFVASPPDVGCTPSPTPQSTTESGGAHLREDSILKLRHRTTAQPLARERSSGVDDELCDRKTRRHKCGVTIYFSSLNPAVVPIGLALLVGHEAETKRLS
jgi:hypothetical protein